MGHSPPARHCDHQHANVRTIHNYDHCKARPEDSPTFKAGYCEVRSLLDRLITVRVCQLAVTLIPHAAVLQSNLVIIGH
jgi:hypothetical protein